MRISLFSDDLNGRYTLTDVAWPDVSIAETAVVASKNIKNAVQNWDSLKMVFSNGQYKPASTSFLFPRSANPLDIKIFDMRGKIVREFHVSFISGRFINYPMESLGHYGKNGARWELYD